MRMNERLNGVTVFLQRELLLTPNIPNQFAAADHKGAVTKPGYFAGTRTAAPLQPPDSELRVA